MSFSDIEELIKSEQKLQLNSFVDSNDIDTYITKIKTNAEVITHYVSGKCAGFIAFYCNDDNKESSFITLVLLSPEFRGKGLATSLLHYTLDYSRRKGFRTCALEVKKNNEKAIVLYENFGFKVDKEINHKYIMSINL